MRGIRSVGLTLFGIIFMVCNVYSQLIDSFSDGDFTSNPAWSGSVDNWEIVTDSDVAAGATNSFTLRLKAPGVSQTEYLSTQRTASWGVAQTWGFWLGRRNQTATGFNTSYVWLWANEADLTSSTVDGYRIRFGDNSDGDELHFERVVDGSATTVFSTTAVTNGLEDIGILVRITRSAASEWRFYTSTLPAADGEGPVATEIPGATNTPVLQGTFTESQFTDFSNGYFGFMAKHTTSTDATAGAEFDQLYFVPEFDHPIPVELLSFEARVAEKEVVLFWQTASETENAGFHIFRSEHAAGPFVRITDGLIPGVGNSRQTHTYQWIDATVQFGKTYYYRLADLDFNGVMTYHGPVMVRVEKLPKSFDLKQNYPNPFNPETTIEFSLLNATRIELSVFDIWGRHIVTLLQGEVQPGHHRVKWNGADQNGLALPSGLYLYRLQAKKFSMQKAMLKVK